VLFCEACQHTWMESSGEGVTPPRQRDAEGPLQPAVPGSGTPLEAAGAPAADHLRCKAHLPCVLVVDDEPTIRAVLQRMLSLKGLCSIAVADEAEATVAAQHESFSAFVIDVHLRAGRSGLDLLGWLRHQDVSRTTPMFVLTGEHHLPEHQQAFLRDHQAHVFFKGESLLRLVDRIKAVVAPPGL
jgi:CheY-like chemotaxis protein